MRRIPAKVPLVQSRISKTSQMGHCFCDEAFPTESPKAPNRSKHCVYFTQFTGAAETGRPIKPHSKFRLLDFLRQSHSDEPNAMDNLYLTAVCSASCEPFNRPRITNATHVQSRPPVQPPITSDGKCTPIQTRLMPTIMAMTNGSPVIN